MQSISERSMSMRLQNIALSLLFHGIKKQIYLIL